MIHSSLNDRDSDRRIFSKPLRNDEACCSSTCDRTDGESWPVVHALEGTYDDVVKVGIDGYRWQ